MKYRPYQSLLVLLYSLSILFLIVNVVSPKYLLPYLFQHIHLNMTKYSLQTEESHVYILIRDISQKNMMVAQDHFITTLYFHLHTNGCCLKLP
jgi:hypothetical protein